MKRRTSSRPSRTSRQPSRSTRVAPRDRASPSVPAITLARPDRRRGTSVRAVAAGNVFASASARRDLADRVKVVVEEVKKPVQNNNSVKNTLPPAALLRRDRNNDDTNKSPALASTLRGDDINRCKSRPARSTRGGGTRRGFIPWCK